MVFSSEEANIEDECYELDNKLSFSPLGDGFLKKVMESGKEKAKGKILRDGMNNGMGSFIPDDIYKNLVKNYSYSKKLYGKSFITSVTGFSEEEIDKNIRIPEFQRELEKKINENIEKLKREEFLDKNNRVSEKGIEFVSYMLYLDEFLELKAKRSFFGNQKSKKISFYGDRGDKRKFRREDRYKDIDLRSSIRVAIKRGHKKLVKADLVSNERIRHNKVSVVYAIDTSGSMKGEKLLSAKKGGIALSYTAISKGDKVGLVLFSGDIKERILPTSDFSELLVGITKANAALKTDIAKTIVNSIDMFKKANHTKHLILLTDCMATAGSDPARETLIACEKAKNNGITISVCGIDLNEEGLELAKKMVEIGNGRLYLVRNCEELDMIILDDYGQL